MTHQDLLHDLMSSDPGQNLWTLAWSADSSHTAAEALAAALGARRLARTSPPGGPCWVGSRQGATLWTAGRARPTHHVTWLNVARWAQTREVRGAQMPLALGDGTMAEQLALC